MNKQSIYKISKYDYIIIATVLIFSFSFILSGRNFLFNNEKKAIIYKNNELIKEINLSLLKNINYIRNDNMEIEIKQGCIRVIKSDCSQKICMHTGWIENPGQIIVCLPNKLFIEIVGISSDMKYNSISY